MPFPGEHAARQRDPGAFQADTFRRKQVADGVSFILGKLKGENAMTVQSIRFDKTKFSVVQAKTWLARNHFRSDKFEAASRTAKASAV